MRILFCGGLQKNNEVAGEEGGLRRRGFKMKEITVLQQEPSSQGLEEPVVQRIDVTLAFVWGLYNKFYFSNNMSGFRFSRRAISRQLINTTVSSPPLLIL